jgi:predicted ATPase
MYKFKRNSLGFKLMIKRIKISNYKSINNIDVGLGRLNIIIGENGCGKSNFLEAISLAGAASSEKLDNEFLANRGIRVTPPNLMRSNFEEKSSVEPIEISITQSENDSSIDFKISNDNKPYSNWTSEISDTRLLKLSESFSNEFSIDVLNNILEKMKSNSKIKKGSLLNKSEMKDDIKDYIITTLSKEMLRKISEHKTSLPDDRYKVSIKLKMDSEYEFSKFMIYSPENSALRNFHKEGQVEPLGINGEGLLKLLQVINKSSSEASDDIISSLKLFGWFNGFRIPTDFCETNDNLIIEDKYTKLAFDQRSANEGFLFVLFYVSLIVSPDTPRIFAIDNIDTSLNPKLCIALIKQLNVLAKKYNKQIFATTHNPAVLDGLDLNDKEQCLFVFNRNKLGHTKIKQITAENRPISSATKDYLNLSDSMMRGYLKSLPTNF